MGGFEGQHVRADAFGAAGTPTFSTIDPPEGAVSLLINSANEYVIHGNSLGGGAADRDYFLRFTLLIPTAIPTMDQDVAKFETSGGLVCGAALSLDSATGKLQWGADMGPTALQVGIPYIIEMRCRRNTTTNRVEMEVRVDGVTQFNNSLSINVNTPQRFNLGVDSATFTQSFKYDEWFLNDDQGASDNSWVGTDEQLAFFLPNADVQRDTNWQRAAGGTASLFEAINNTPPIGKADASAGDNDQIENGAITNTEAYVAGYPALDTLIPAGSDPKHALFMLHTGRSSVGNVNIGVDASFDGGSSWEGEESWIAGEAQAGTYPTGWGDESKASQSARPFKVDLSASPPALTVQPRLKLRKGSLSSDRVMCCYAGLYVSYVPGAPPPTDAVVKVKSGGVWSTKPVKVKSGGVFTTKPTKAIHE